MSIGAILLCCFAAGALLIMLAPFVFTTQFSNFPDSRNGMLQLQWIHPWVILIRYNLSDKTMELRLFGVTGKKAGATKDKEEDISAANYHSSKFKTGQSAEIVKTVLPEVSKNKNSQMIHGGPPQSENECKPDRSPVDLSGTPEPETDQNPMDESPGRNRFTWSRLKKTIAILRKGHCGRKVFLWSVRFLCLSFKIIKFDHLRLYAKAGLVDPAAIGKIYGYFTALHSVLFSDRKNMDVRFEPRFMSNVLEIEGSIGLKTSIAGIVLPFAIALATFPYSTVFFVWRRLKKVYSGVGDAKILKTT